MSRKNRFIQLPDKLYKNITGNVPIVCVDIIPVKQINNTWYIGIIKRSTGLESDKLAILGGRISLNETIPEAINRHLLKDLGIHKFTFYKTNKTQTPFYVQQYFLGVKSEKPYGFDPTKHAIALTYLVTINDTPIPKNEASEFRWITKQEIPKKPAFNQDTVMQEAFRYLKS